MNTRTRALLLLMVAAIALSGCAPKVPRTGVSPTAEKEPTASPPADAGGNDTASVRIYLVRDEKIAVAVREVEADDNPSAVAWTTIQALIEGPAAYEKDLGFSTAVPQGTRIISVGIMGDNAVVDLSKEFASGGGSLSMQLRAAQIVCTLMQFDGVKTVSFKLDGKDISALGGEGVKVGPKVTRADFEDMLPAILVESPAPGEAVTSPVTVSGSANVFEARFRVQVTDPEGLIITEQNVQASSGTGTRGTFSAKIEFDSSRTGLGAIIFDVPSPKDGKPTNVVEIPVQMTK